jgi:hypothetical protein
MSKVKIRNTKSTHISELPDNLLAGMIRDSCYARNTTFGTGPTDSKWLLVLAIPYGRDENVDSLPEAFEAFRDMLDTSDWFERQIQVLSIENGKPTVIETSHEQIVADDNTVDNRCSECGEYGSECICG